MKYLNRSKSLLIGLLALFACDLDRFPETEIGKENFFNTEEDLNIYVNSLYNFGGPWVYTNDGGTDNAATTGATELKSMMVGTPTSSNITSGWDWNYLREVNFFLENFHKADISEEKLAHFEGLGRFFRAQFYFDKVKRYSDVPWYDFVLETDDQDALFKSQDPREAVVASIFEDYAFAAEHVFADQPSGAVNQWAVKAYMARNALHEGTFRKYHDELGLSGDEYLRLALTTAQDIMQNSPYSIHNTGDVMNDYGSLFNSPDLSGNSEVILATFSENNLRNSGWWEYMFGNYEMAPGKDLLQAYLMSDGSHYADQAGYQTFDFVSEFVDRDARLYQTFAYPGFELIYTGSFAQGAGLYVQQLAKNFSGYHQLKGFMNTTDAAVTNSLDVPQVRLGEVLLTYAEASAELGQLTQADLDISINLLRDRVGMPHMTTSAGADAWQQSKYPGVSDPLILEVRRERRVELAQEGRRMDDLMRWNAGQLIENEPQGLYFSSLGQHDLTGDAIPDIMLIPGDESIPEDKEVNELGVELIYYRAGLFGEDVGVYLSEGTSGYVQTISDRGTFEVPKYYYRPVPQAEVLLNPNLYQVFGWD